MKEFRILILSMLVVMVTPLEGRAKCVGRFVNPITDICWRCIFPMTIAGIPVVKGEDTATPRSFICKCPHPPYIGIPISFWEPVRLVDVTRTPYCMVNLGGIRVGPALGVRGHGTIGHASKGR
ncbi:MAG: TraU family protein, partial [Alphaproteobacteria bacterium]|nr:TraU family protein [Alphaproteobacteria bacterium]